MMRTDVCKDIVEMSIYKERCENIFEASRDSILWEMKKFFLIKYLTAATWLMKTVWYYFVVSYNNWSIDNFTFTFVILYIHVLQMATIKLSNLIGIDPKPFDPMTYVEEDIYVTDASGSKRCIPPANIIRFREIRNPDGTTSVSYYMEQLLAV